MIGTNIIKPGIIKPGIIKLGVFAASIAFASFASAAAQNTGGVFPPMVDAGSQAVEYRIGYRPGENGADGRSAQRVHYQSAVNDDLMWRLVGQVAGRTGDQGFDYVQGELFWDLSEDGSSWRTGLRFDGRVSDGDGPEQVSINWTNQFDLSSRWTARAVLLTTKQFGDRRAEGVLLETRANLFTRTDGGVTVGLESYNLHGSTDALDVFGGRQQVGPFAVWPVAEGWGLFTGALIGANDASPDADYRIWLTRQF